MRNWVSIAAAGMLGVLARDAVQPAVPRPGNLPWGTLVVNVAGALAIGFVAGFAAHRLTVPLWVQEALTVGFLGGFTTFSALALETVTLLDRGRYVVAVSYSSGTVLAGVTAVFLGLRLARLT
jgi:fluoride exporter